MHESCFDGLVMPTETVPNAALTPEELRYQKRIEYSREYYQKHREEQLSYHHEYYQKNRERIREKFKERYHSDPAFRENRLNRVKIWYTENKGKRGRYLEKRREAFRELKIVLGGKCTFNGCEERDLDILEPHHPDGKKEGADSFLKSSELTKWIKYRIIPNVVLLCPTHHQKLHRSK